MVLLYVSFTSQHEAQKIIQTLLEKSFIESSSLIPTTKMVMQDESIQQLDEYVAFIKTTKELANYVKAEVEKLHSDDVPCIVEIDVKANRAYRELLASVVCTV